MNGEHLPFPIVPKVSNKKFQYGKILRTHYTYTHIIKSGVQYAHSDLEM